MLMIMRTHSQNHVYLSKHLLRLSCTIFFAFIIFSCKIDFKEFDPFGESDFSETVELKHSVLNQDQMLMRPAGIRIYENYLFIQNRGTAYFYEVYDLNANKRINECIKAGKGTEEMIAPFLTCKCCLSLKRQDFQNRLLFDCSGL
jgi:hypothetical protein